MTSARVSPHPLGVPRWILLLLCVACLRRSTEAPTTGQLEELLRELPSDCGPLRHLATAADGSLVCLHAGFRFWVTSRGIERSATAAPIEDAAPVEGGWVFVLEESATFAATPVAPLRELGPFPRDVTLVSGPRRPGFQRGAYVRAFEGRVFEANADGTREIAVDFPVDRAVAFGDQRALLSVAGTVVHGAWGELRPVGQVDAATFLRLDATGPVITTLDGEQRRIDGSIVSRSPRRRPTSPDEAIRRLAAVAHAASPLPGSVTRRGDGETATLVGDRLLVRARDGSVASHPTRGSRVVGASSDGWFVESGSRLLHLSRTGSVLAEWPRRTFSNGVGWWGTCEAPASHAPEAFPADACFLDHAGRPRPVRLPDAFVSAHCGDRLYVGTGPIVEHDLRTGRAVEHALGVNGTCGPRGALVEIRVSRVGSAWLVDSDRGPFRAMPFSSGWVYGASNDGELVVRANVGDEAFDLHSRDDGVSWRRVTLGERILCDASGCFTDSPEGYVAVVSLPTASTSPSSERGVERPDPYEDGWGALVPFELSCERQVVRGARSPERVTLVDANRFAVRELDGQRWEASVEGATFVRSSVLAIGARVVVTRASCGRVFRLAPEGVVELRRPPPRPLVRCPRDVRGLASRRALVEPDGRVVVLWVDDCAAEVRRFDSRGRVLAYRRFETHDGGHYDFATHDARTYVARIARAAPYELIPIAPDEMPKRLDLPPLRQWSPRICRDDEPAGSEFVGLLLPPHGMARLRRVPDGDVCVLGSIGEDGFVARGGQLVRRFREEGVQYEERCSLAVE